MPPNDLIDIAVLPAPWLKEFYPIWTECRQRILVVADGSLDFNEGNDFGLTEFLKAIETASPYGLAPQITIAHRTNNPSLASATMQAKFTYLPGFVFENSAASRAIISGTSRRFDQIWLFGITSTPIGDDEVRAIAAFMNARGGVFATGDHSSLGSGMSARLPRIRKMREWSAVPMGGPNRIDTVNEPGGDSFWEFRDQSDDIPQRIFPHFKLDSLGTHRPHPLLRRPGVTSYHDVIDVLPDHPHESECYAGSNLTQPYNLVTGVDTNEFPALGITGAPLSPEIVATSMSGGRIVEKGPVAPRSFGAISAYDGFQVSRGRIVCDATWHHFVNINLDGTLSGRSGLKGSTGTPTLAYQKVTQYFRNIAEWLGPRRRCRAFLDLAVERFRFPLAEELATLPRSADFAELREIGRRVAAALESTGGRGRAADFVEEVLEGGPEPLQRLLSGKGPKGEDLLVPTADVALATLGSVAMSVFSQLPESAWEVRKRFESAKGMHDVADKAIQAGVERAAAVSAQHLERAARQAAAIAKTLAKGSESPVAAD